ncbi:hypothetical protein CRG98_024239 [Punica granatum]|uniref:Uncharacterized protein n=1 Tax=Punica granatum TaxID=22663 RepID=A0A2I0JGL5_PUNGR|nr:hypothetical protein CRG98_024239 [Punica granatum]
MGRFDSRLFLHSPRSNSRAREQEGTMEALSMATKPQSRLLDNTPTSRPLATAAKGPRWPPTPSLWGHRQSLRSLVTHIERVVAANEVPTPPIRDTNYH